MIKAAIINVTGYAGMDLARLLHVHPEVELTQVTGRSMAGQKLREAFPHLGDIDLTIQDEVSGSVDVAFSALPQTASAEACIPLVKSGVKVIDISADFRLKNPTEYEDWYGVPHPMPSLLEDSVYGLTELYRAEVKGSNLIANPGCYPTSILLPLIPLLKKNIISEKNIVIDSKSGFSGAGRGVHKKKINKNLYGSLSAYGVGFHRHNSEIEQELKKVSKKKIEFIFTPHLTPMFRGILSTIYCNLPKKMNPKKVYNNLKKVYKNMQFIKFAKFNSAISTNQVINSNKCLISVCKSKYKDKVVILSAIDNLIKGGSGQGVQNMNIIYNFPESRGLV